MTKKNIKNDFLVKKMSMISNPLKISLLNSQAQLQMMNINQHLKKARRSS